MRPTDVLFHRRILLEDCDQITRAIDAVIGPEGTVDDLRALVGARRGKGDEKEWAVLMAVTYHQLRRTLPLAPAYYVSDDMTAVARVAAQTMPDQPLLLTDLPSEEGFMLWDAPISWLEDDSGRTPVKGVVWSIQDGAVYLFPLLPHPEQRNALVPHYQTHYTPGEIPDEVVTDTAHILRPVLTTWTLMQQSLSVSTPEPANRQERRQATRRDLPPEVVVLRLRRLSTSTENETEETAVAWSHRWLVGGHWRNQYLPSKDAHRLQWISPYVKGPEGLPLIVKEKVTAWIR